MRYEVLLLYFVTWLVVALTPGPAVMCSMSNASRFGFRMSLAGIAGIQAGNVLFFICAALGLGVILAKATALFNALRIIGAIYLFYLGARTIIATFRRTAVATPEKPATSTRGKLFVHGALIQLTNPKALLFVSALLPQFLDPTRSSFLQFTILGIVTIVVDLMVLSGYAYLAARGVQSFRNSAVCTYLERVFGAALICFGVRLGLSQK